MPGVDDHRVLARYPFLAEARAWVQEGGYVLGDLLKDPAYERPRRRAVQRVKSAFQKDGLPEANGSSETDSTVELLSYPLARALVATVGDSYLASRYAVGEAKLLHGRLSADDDDTLWTVAASLQLPLRPAEQAFARIHFLDYLRHAPGRDPAWKLVNQALDHGWVELARDRIVRLCEEAYRERLLEELDGLERPGRPFLEAFEVDLNQIRTMLAAHRAKFESDTEGPVRPEAFPPCIQAVWNGIKGHVNVPHMGRFAIVSFLHTLGMNSEDILKFFSSVPDFDASKSRYQIEHITGKIGATQYTPPSCGTMQTYGICPLEQRDDICLRLIHHPLAYYRKKLWVLGPAKPAAPPKEVTDAPAPAT